MKTESPSKTPIHAPWVRPAAISRRTVLRYVMSELFAGVDLGGTSIKAAVVDAAGVLNGPEENPSFNWSRALSFLHWWNYAVSDLFTKTLYSL